MNRRYLLERVDDAAVVQVYADTFQALPLRDKILVWHLYQEIVRAAYEYYARNAGNYESARSLFETYGIHFDPALRDEIVARVDALRLPSYTAIVMPRLTPRYRDGDIADVEISYPCDLETQMLEFSAFGRSADVVATPAASR